MCSIFRSKACWRLGVVAIILGLALQSTLGDVFSGIVLSFSRPYRPGDWVSIDGGTDGRVVELNWRATYILTARRDLAIVPNSTIAKSKIVNVSSPSGLHGTTVTVQVDAGTPPSRCSEILEHAIRNSRLIVATPAPTITVKAINATYTEFEIALLCRGVGLDCQGSERVVRFHLSTFGRRGNRSGNATDGL